METFTQVSLNQYCLDGDGGTAVYELYECSGVGAVPPWLLEDPEDKSAAGNSQDIGPSLQDFLKHSKQGLFC